jgi:hypothetical protein
MDIVNAIGDVDEGVIAFKIENGEFTIVPGILRLGTVTFNVTDFTEATGTNYKRNEPITANIGTDYNMYNADGSDELEENLKPTMTAFMKDLYEYYRNDNELVRDEEAAAQIAAQEAKDAQIEEEKRLAQEAKDAADKVEEEKRLSQIAAEAVAAQEVERLAQEAQTKADKDAKDAADKASQEAEDERLAQEQARIAEEEEKNNALENARKELKKLKEKIETDLKDLIFTFNTKIMKPLISKARGIHTTLISTSNPSLTSFNKNVKNFVNSYNSYKEDYIKLYEIYNKIEQIELSPELTSLEQIGNELKRITKIGTEYPELIRKLKENFERSVVVGVKSKSTSKYTGDKSVKELFDELVDIRDESFLKDKYKNSYEIKNISGSNVIKLKDVVKDDKYIEDDSSGRKIGKELINEMVNFILEKDMSHTTQRKEQSNINPLITPKQPVVPPLPIGQTPPYQKNTASSARSITPRSSRSQLQTPDSTRRSDALYKLNTTAKKRPRSNDS